MNWFPVYVDTHKEKTDSCLKRISANFFVVLIYFITFKMAIKNKGFVLANYPRYFVEKRFKFNFIFFTQFHYVYVFNCISKPNNYN